MTEHRSPETGEVVVRDPTPDMRAALEALKTLGDESIDRVLPRVGHAILSEAQFAAPVATGFLKSQHTLGRYDKDAKTIALQVNTGYALARHERWPAKPGHQWFRRAMLQHAPGFMQRAVAAEIKRVAEEARNAARTRRPS